MTFAPPIPPDLERQLAAERRQDADRKRLEAKLGADPVFGLASIARLVALLALVAAFTVELMK